MTPLGIVGSGLIGTELATLAVKAGIPVVLANSRGPESLADLVARLGPKAAAATAEEAAGAADVVVVSVPLGNVPDLDPRPLAGKIVIDTMNYYPHRDGRIADLDSHRFTTAEWVQRHLAGARTVKTFSNISYHHLPQLARAQGAGDRSALPMAGDNAGAKATVAELAGALGYDLVDAGTLAQSWVFDPDTAPYLTPYAAGELKSLMDLRSTPGAPVAATEVEALLARSVRPSVGDRTF